MAIWRHLDGWDEVRNFEEAYVGPGVYVLFDGSTRDDNIVYIGKSTKRILMHVRQHRSDKDFTRVGVILPRRTNDAYIHNLEHFVMEEYVERFGELPPYNIQRARFYPGGPSFRWHDAARRPSDVGFGGCADPSRGDLTFRTVGDLRCLSDEMFYDGTPRWETFEVIADACDRAYSAATLGTYYYGPLHGNTVLPAFRAWSLASCAGRTNLLS